MLVMLYCTNNVQAPTQTCSVLFVNTIVMLLTDVVWLADRSLTYDRVQNSIYSFEGLSPLRVGFMQMRKLFNRLVECGCICPGSSIVCWLLDPVHPSRASRSGSSLPRFSVNGRRVNDSHFTSTIRYLISLT